jgi:hypothetical protein
MKVTLRASTAAKIVVWLDGDLYHARLAESADRPQTCIDVDLFEVVAELAGLDLNRGEQAAEAMRLAEVAQRRLAPRSGHPDDELEPDGDDDAADDSRSACGEA